MSIESKTIETLLQRYSAEEGKSALMPLLQDIQDSCGYLPEEKLEQVSSHLNVPLSHIYGVVSFYSQFSLVPRGKHIIKLCVGTACHIKGAQSVLDQIQAHLGIADKETTEDKNFTLEGVRCLGACALAPLMVVDGKYYDAVTPARALKLLKKLQKAQADGEEGA